MNRLPITALRWFCGCAVSLALLLHAVGLWNLPWVQQMESTLYDLRVRTTLTNAADPRIVILDIDEKSLAHPQLGRWPWGRNRLAQLMDILFTDYHMAAVGFDVVHAEADRSDGLLALEEFSKQSPQHEAAINQALKSYRPMGSNDAQFQAVLKNYPIVLGYYFTQRTTTPATAGPTISRASTSPTIPPLSIISFWRAHGPPWPSATAAMKWAWARSLPGSSPPISGMATRSPV